MARSTVPITSTCWDAFSLGFVVVGVGGDMVGWAPDTNWEAVTDAGGSATRGVWRAERDDQRWIVKRLECSGKASTDVRHHSWWRREAEVATSAILNDSRGLRPATIVDVNEDAEGITLWSHEVPAVQIAEDVLAYAYGRFNNQSVQDPGWFNQDMLRHRIAATDDGGGIGPLRDTGLIDHTLLQTCAVLWSMRGLILDELARLPHVLSHGDALPRNMLCLDGEDVIAIDWGQLGYNVVGADLATLCLYSEKGLDELIPSYCEGLGESEQSVDEATVRGATHQVAALIATSRASRAVVAGGDLNAYLGRLIHAEPILQEAAWCLMSRCPRNLIGALWGARV